MLYVVFISVVFLIIGVELLFIRVSIGGVLFVCFYQSIFTSLVDQMVGKLPTV